MNIQTYKIYDVTVKMSARIFFFLMIRRPPRSTFFPSPTLFRSLLGCRDLRGDQHTGGARGFPSADMADAARRARAVSRFYAGICDRIQRLTARARRAASAMSAEIGRAHV